MKGGTQSDWMFHSGVPPQGLAGWDKSHSVWFLLGGGGEKKRKKFELQSSRIRAVLTLSKLLLWALGVFFKGQVAPTAGMSQSSLTLVDAEGSRQGQHICLPHAAWWHPLQKLISFCFHTRFGMQVSLHTFKKEALIPPCPTCFNLKKKKFCCLRI